MTQAACACAKRAALHSLNELRRRCLTKAARVLPAVRAANSARRVARRSRASVASLRRDEGTSTYGQRLVSYPIRIVPLFLLSFARVDSNLSSLPSSMIRCCLPCTLRFQEPPCNLSLSGFFFESDGLKKARAPFAP